ncbi:hypothetical protein M422DRAFT_55748 [Sphaerobolus stellatus SS14]|uniref:Uncharacterized protein n=1 Tax=Sphaerobolus stellatus (strain SS14) TaxID=990650 RepID=A0A0C9TA16_SPHS4|nr:hypothetical protein M422DRAFT_55748 [Sphaerobolus stellatus SS14]
MARIDRNHPWSFQKHEPYTVDLVQGLVWELCARFPVRTCAKLSVNELFLFIDKPVLEKSGYSTKPNAYWSTCPNGSSVLEKWQLLLFGIAKPPQIFRQCIPARFEFAKKTVLGAVYEACGFNPNCNDVTTFLGYTLPQHLPLSILASLR